MPGVESSFLPGDKQDVGLAENLQGAVNAAAGGTGVFDKTAAQNAQDANMKADLDLAASEDVEIFRDALAAVVSSVCPAGSKGLGVSAERDVVLLAYQYGDFLQRAKYKQMPDDVAELFKKGFAAAVATSIGINDSEGANYLSTALAAQGKDSGTL